jgi:hypothetical protein
MVYEITVYFIQFIPILTFKGPRFKWTVALSGPELNAMTIATGACFYLKLCIFYN